MEEEREGEKHQCVITSHALPTGDLAHNPGMSPGWESNWWPFGLQAGTQSTEPHQPGSNYCIFHTNNCKPTFAHPCMYICVYMYMYTYIHINIHMHIHIWFELMLHMIELSSIWCQSSSHRQLSARGILSSREKGSRCLKVSLIHPPKVGKKL